MTGDEIIDIVNQAFETKDKHKAKVMILDLIMDLRFPKEKENRLA